MFPHSPHFHPLTDFSKQTTIHNQKNKQTIYKSNSKSSSESDHDEIEISSIISHSTSLHSLPLPYDDYST